MMGHIIDPSPLKAMNEEAMTEVYSKLDELLFKSPNQFFAGIFSS